MNPLCLRVSVFDSKKHSLRRLRFRLRRIAALGFAAFRRAAGYPRIGAHQAVYAGDERVDFVRGLHDGVGVHRLHDVLVEGVRLGYGVFRLHVALHHARAHLLGFLLKLGVERGVCLAHGFHFLGQSQRGYRFGFGVEHRQHAPRLGGLLRVFVAAVMSLFTWVWKSLHEPMVIALIPKNLICCAIIVFYLR